METVCEQILEENEVSRQTDLWGETNAKINTAVSEKPGPSAWLERAGRAVEWREAGEAGRRHAESSGATQEFEWTSYIAWNQQGISSIIRFLF